MQDRQKVGPGESQRSGCKSQGAFSTQKSPNRSDEAQLFNELKATGICVGLLINFGPTKVEFKRFVF